VKINSSANGVIYSTYLGGNGSVTTEQANHIAVDYSGNAYITGVTNSANFPVTTGAFQATYNGDQDAFVTKINPSGSALVYSTYLGGTSFDWGSGIALDQADNAYVTGYTSSFNFPTTGLIQPNLDAGYDAFVSMLNSTGGVLAFLLISAARGSIRRIRSPWIPAGTCTSAAKPIPSICRCIHPIKRRTKAEPSAGPLASASPRPNRKRPPSCP